MENQEVNAPVSAPDVAPQSELVTTPAPEVAAPGTEGDLQLDAETLKFLENQNIKLDNPAEAIAELARRNQDLRARKPDMTQPKAQEALDVLQPPVTPEAPKLAEQKTITGKSLSDIDIATTAMYVKNTYKDVDVDAQFYRDMIKEGFQPVDRNGIRLQSVMNYAAYRQKLVDADRAIQQANTVPTSQIPDPNLNVQPLADVNKVEAMTADAAQSIVVWDNQQKQRGMPGHPQLAEAVAFLQKK